MIAASPAASRRCDFLCGRFRACIRVVNPRSVLCVLWDELPSRYMSTSSKTATVSTAAAKLARASRPVRIVLMVSTVCRRLRNGIQQ